MVHAIDIGESEVTEVAVEQPAIVLAEASTVRATLRLVHATFWFTLIVGSYRFQNLLARCGLGRKRWDEVHAKNAERFYRAAVSLGGLWLKIGQMLSVMGTFLPSVWTQKLGRLQDRVPPRAWKVVERTLDAAYGRPVESVFATIEHEAVAAASLGQVHRGRLFDGRKVAIKVLYPDVRARFRTDLKVVGWVLAVMRRYLPLNELDRVHQQLAEMLASESDLRIEARALRTMGRAFAASKDVVLPQVVTELSGPTVLVMDWVDGVRITDRSALNDLGITAHDAARKLLDVFFRQVFEHHFVHADPHPGNFLVQKADDGSVKIALLDLGSATTVRPTLVKGLVQVLGAVFAKNEAGILAGIETMGFVAPGGDKKQLVDAIKKSMPLIMGASGSTQPPSFDRKEARELAKAVVYPEGWLPLERAIMLVGATCANEAPDLAPAQVAFPHVARYFARGA